MKQFDERDIWDVPGTFGSFTGWIFDVTSADWRLWLALYGVAIACGAGAMALATGLLLFSLVQGWLS